MFCILKTIKPSQQQKQRKTKVSSHMSHLGIHWQTFLQGATSDYCLTWELPYWPQVASIPSSVVLPPYRLRAANKNNPTYIKQRVPVSSPPDTLCSLALLNVRPFNINNFISSTHVDFYVCQKPGWNLVNTASSQKFVPLATAVKAQLPFAETVISVVPSVLKSWCLKPLVQVQTSVLLCTTLQAEGTFLSEF